MLNYVSSGQRTLTQPGSNGGIANEIVSLTGNGGVLRYNAYQVSTTGTQGATIKVSLWSPDAEDFIHWFTLRW